MRVLVATDAWHPQVNGVVRTLTMTAEAAKAFGADVGFLTPQSFHTVAMPSYPDLRLALPYGAKIARLIDDARPDSIHIATEGPIGLSVRRYCRKHGVPFTTSFHTRFPEYVSARLPVRESWIWAALRAFHRNSQAVMAATPALANELRARGFRNVVLWPRGVDTSLFHPRTADLGLPRPVFLCVGRVAVEKNLEAFLELELPGTKVIVGDGPARAALARKISASRVPRRAAGRRTGRNLCRCRHLRVSQQDRHVRPGAVGGSCQRRSGCRFSRDRSPRRTRLGAGRRVE
jgi:glycosyltransferase involved in cell wall biosynthesis